MPYVAPYEALGAERFQQFCQSLLVREHPGIQVSPYNQADGGRDATAGGALGRNSLVFQVKFVEQPARFASPEAWLRRTLARERPRIEQLAARGVTTYRLLTNMPGTARAGSGTIDRVDALLETLPIADARCWWRDDLDRRLDGHPVLKWSFRELLSGSDVLEQLLAAGLTEDRDRRARAIRSFLAVQHEDERLVRFRQVEMRERLLDLWVDVPLRAPARQTRFGAAVAAAPDDDPHLRPGVGAATALLGSSSEVFDRFVVHGAPGQGKSTLSQYLGEVQRLRLLGLDDDARALGADADSPLRLPLKAELPQLAAFLAGDDPFADGRPLPPGTPQTLEAFLAHLVSSKAGGDRFDVSDLKAVLGAGPILLLLDGLDEVPDVHDRDSVVRAVTVGQRSLAANAPELRTIVTSRPHAFVGSIDFDPDEWAYGTLDTLPRPLVDRYLMLWSRAKGRTAAETARLGELLDVRLRDRTFADLARNPMQLAIVLSLLERHGDALPDRRTELYDAYMQHFLDREAASNPIIARHRRLIFTLHGRLGYALHCRVEQERKRTFTHDELRVEIAAFLVVAGESPDLLDTLFVGVVARVMALVSRRSGTFEFEVQPLQEFFAGYHLYATKQVDKRPGSLLDRFDALARNPHWLNALRFCAGNYGLAELSSLADGLEDLAEDPVWGRTDRPRVLTNLLLADDTFALGGRARARAIEVLARDVPARHAFTTTTELEGPSEALVVVEREAATRAAERAFEALKHPLPADRGRALAWMLRLHADVAPPAERWTERLADLDGDARSGWIVLALLSGALDRLPGDAVLPLVADAPIDADSAAWLLTHEPEAVEQSAPVSARVVEAIVGGALLDRPRRPPRTAIELFATVVADARAGRVERAVERVLGELESLPASETDAGRTVVAFLERVSAFAARLRSAAALTDALIGELRAAFGDHRLWCDIAIAVSGRGNVEPTARVTPDRSPVRFAADARTRHRGFRDTDWWLAQAGGCTTRMARQLVMSTLLRWGSAHQLRRLEGWLAEQLDDLSGEEYGLLASMVATTDGRRLYEFDPRNATEALRGLVLDRLGDETGDRVVAGLLDGLPALDDGVVRSLGEHLVKRVLDKTAPAGALAAIADVYARLPRWEPRLRSGRLDVGSAHEVLDRPERFPLLLVGRAEETIGAVAAREVRPLDEIAQEHAWFEFR